MSYVSQALRIFASCVAAALAAFVAWYAFYAIMWLLTWLIAALAAAGVAWLAYSYVNGKLATSNLSGLGLEGVSAKLSEFKAGFAAGWFEPAAVE